MKGIVARKVGMTRVIAPDTGVVTPVTLLEAPEGVVLQVKTVENDGYSGAVLGAFPRKKDIKNVGGKYKVVKEFCCCDGVSKGDKVTLANFEDVESVKITGVSKGRGFSGVVKRHGFKTGRNSHGSHHHREPGSVGMCSKPGRILKGKKMPGRYGTDKVTLRSVPVVRVDAANNVIAVKGAVPGPKNGFVFLSA